jgi:hypothetical protein
MHHGKRQERSRGAKPLGCVTHQLVVQVRDVVRQCRLKFRPSGTQMVLPGEMPNESETLSSVPAQMTLEKVEDRPTVPQPACQQEVAGKKCWMSGGDHDLGRHPDLLPGGGVAGN